ncbi:MAG: hypothetical protein JXA30_03150 [Deltaproteobacteria bacterium]|nr:hypothetical protein [Deltaproteobacteria bacterium]
MARPLMMPQPVKSDARAQGCPYRRNRRAYRIVSEIARADPYRGPRDGV